jgi:AraC-like DNA-binding protein
MDKMEISGRYSVQIIECHYQRPGHYWDGKRYFSSTWRYYYSEKAGSKILIDDSWIELVPEECYLIAPGTTFNTYQQEQPFQFYVHFTCGKPFDGAQKKIYSLPLDDRMKEDMAVTKQELKEHGTPFTPRGSMRVASLCTYALSCIPAGEVVREFSDPRIERLVLQIRAYPHDRLSIEDMAAYCNLSKGAFMRLFKENTNETPHTFVLQCRIRKAKYLLETTDLTIEEITHLCGFEDRFHFSRTFKRINDTSPAQHRKNAQQEAG